MPKKTRFELILILAACCTAPSLFAHEAALTKTLASLGSQRLILDAFISDSAPQEVGDQVTPIEPGKPVERELRGGEKHTYEIHVDAGQFLHAVVEQLGIDVKWTPLRKGKRWPWLVVQDMAAVWEERTERCF